MSLVIALAAMEIVVGVIMVKAFRGRNGEIEKGEGMELMYVDVKRGMRGWMGMGMMRYVDVAGGIDQVGEGGI